MLESSSMLERTGFETVALLCRRVEGVNERLGRHKLVTAPHYHSWPVGVGCGVPGRRTFCFSYGKAASVKAARVSAAMFHLHNHEE